jgi:hypothetical protein
MNPTENLLHDFGYGDFSVSGSEAVGCAEHPIEVTILVRELLVETSMGAPETDTDFVTVCDSKFMCELNGTSSLRCGGTDAYDFRLVPYYSLRTFHYIQSFSGGINADYFNVLLLTRGCNIQHT